MKEQIEQLMREHYLLGYTRAGAGSVRIEPDKVGFRIVVGDLPNLSFFVALAKLANVPLESIETEDDHFGGGCDTCGYGGGTEYKITVPVKLT